ncbi:MAG: AAA family ATPase [Geminicoccaceae bacterium]
MPETDQSATIAFLEHGAFAGPVERIDTHAAIVFLEGERAWKMKRAVRFSFLDFTTLAQREAAIRAELRLNRRTAPELYREVVPVTRGDAGLAVGGDGRPVEWLLAMQRFPDDALYSRIADRGALSGPLVDELAATLAAFHDAAEVRRDKGGLAGMREVVEGNAVDLGRLAGDVLPAQQVEAVTRLSRERLKAATALLERRRDEGRVRHCHGDLHLRNIVRLGDRPVLFDCIEFNDDFACIDVLYDLAFLLMDLADRRLAAAAQRLLQGYVEASGEAEGLALLPLFIGARAAIRAKVEGFAVAVQADATAAAEHAGLAGHYLDLARRALQPAPPRLVAIGGRSGTGKSSLAAALAPEIGAMPGAVVLRSDVIRKRLLGRAPTERLPEEAYTAEVSGRVFAAIAERAAVLLGAGQAVIADAVYGHAEQRHAIEAVARRAGVPFTGFWLEAPERVLTARVEARTGDASDADARVVRLQREIDDSRVAWTRLEAGRPLAEVAEAARRALGQENPRGDGT